MITPRLNSILNNISGNTMADIGTDHAYIPIELVRENMVNRAIACDIRPGPLEIAQKNVKKYGLDGKIELRLGAGFKPLLLGETETVVVAGMGGEMIINILSEDLKKSKSFKELILQPMNCQAELRRWLAENGFSVFKEDLALEGFKIYNLLAVRPEKGGNYVHEIDYHLPPELTSHPLFCKLKEKKIREFTKIRSGLLKAEKKDGLMIEKYTNLLKECEKI